MAHDIVVNIKIQFEQFLTTVGDVLSHDKQIRLIQKNLRRHFTNAASFYLSSTDFRSLLIRVHRLFIENKKSTKFFKVLNLFDEELKKHGNKSIRPKETSNELVHSTNILRSEPPLLPIADQMPSNLNESSTSKTTEESPMAISAAFPVDVESKRKNKIDKLERRLSRLSRIIRQLEEKELSLDEMIYSDLYQVEAQLKKQAYDIYIKLADLKNQSSSVERILDQPVTLVDEEIDHPLINKALEDMVNQSRFLPSFHEVFNIVEKTNDKHKLVLSVEAQKIIAEKAFKIIGVKVKNRRMADFRDIMNSRLPEDFDMDQNDPALNSTEIEKKLFENEQEAERKTQQIFEEFSQIDPDVQPEINVESSEESTIDSDDDDDDDSVTSPSLETPARLPSNSTEMMPNDDPVEVFTISDDDTQKIQRTTVQTVIPRRRQNHHESITNVDTSRTTKQSATNESSTTPKRPFHDFNSSSSKKRPQISKFIVYD